jgi:hypothetical protein
MAVLAIGWLRSRMIQCMVRPCVARGFRRAGVSGLASMYPVSDWSWSAPDHHGYQRACVLISGQASTGHLGHQCSHAPGRTDPPSLLILSQTSAGKAYQSGYVIADSSFFGLCCRWRRIGIKRIGSLPDRSSAPRMPGHGLGRSRRCGRAYWRVRSPARCDAAASWPPRSRA